MNNILTENHSFRLQEIYTDDNKTFYLYFPKPWRLLCYHFEKMTFVRRIRLLLECLAKGGYKVFYLAVNDDLVGYCVVTPGNRRLRCSSNNDIVLGPYYIDSRFRGNGYSKDLIGFVVNNAGLSYRYAYDHIEKTNIPSIRASVACGFKKCGELNVEGPLRRLVECPNGNHEIYRYAPKETSFAQNI